MASLNLFEQALKTASPIFFRCCLCRFILILWWCIDCKLKTGCQWQITSALHDAVSVGREQHVLQPLALAALSVRAFRAVAHAHVHSINAFVWFSVMILTL